MISVDRISKRYGEITAVDDVSFEIDRGEVVGFLGPNGAGKSTTMRVLTGTLEPDAGEIRFDGRPIAEDLTAAKARVGYLPETNALYPEMLVSEYLAYAGELHGVGGAALRSNLKSAVEETGLESVFTRPIGQLSKGFRQRVGLAAAILHQPELLVLDEPTEGLDPNQRVEIRHLINQLGEERTVLLSTHVLAEVEATGGRLIIIHEGRLVADGTVAELLEGLRSGARYRVEAKGEDVARTLSALEGVSSHETAPVDDRVRVDLTASGPADLRPTIFETATRKGWTLWELHRERDSLEELFRELTSGHAPAAGPADPPSSGSPAEEDGGTDTGGEG